MTLDINPAIALAPAELNNILERPSVKAAAHAVLKNSQLVQETADVTEDALHLLVGYSTVASLIGLLTAVSTLVGNMEAATKADASRPYLYLVRKESNNGEY